MPGKRPGRAGVTAPPLLSRGAAPGVHGEVEGDRALVEGLRRGEAGAFEAAYGRYRARVHAFLLRLARDAGVAEDLLQETWLRLARSATRLDGQTDLAAWLFTVARNLHVSHRRWRLLDVERMRALRLWPRGGGTPTPFDHAEANETERRLEAALGRLPAAYREALLLVTAERFEPHQAAAILGLSADAARQRIARARAMLRKALGEEPGHVPAAEGGAT